MRFLLRKLSLQVHLHSCLYHKRLEDNHKLVSFPNGSVYQFEDIVQLMVLQVDRSLSHLDTHNLSVLDMGQVFCNHSQVKPFYICCMLGLVLHFQLDMQDRLPPVRLLLELEYCKDKLPLLESRNTLLFQRQSQLPQ